VGFGALRKRAGVSDRVVPYCARHTYGTYALEATGNTFAVADSMGHADLQSMKPYQHARLDSVREAINRRNREIVSRHVYVTVLRMLLRRSKSLADKQGIFRYLDGGRGWNRTTNLSIKSRANSIPALQANVHERNNMQD